MADSAATTHHSAGLQHLALRQQAASEPQPQHLLQAGLEAYLLQAQRQHQQQDLVQAQRQP